MFMSSPFRASHRRSRSHSSLSSPGSSPVNRHDVFRSRPIHSPPRACADSPVVFAGPAFASQPPEKWDVEAWRRGKRVRRGQPTPPEDADMELYDEPIPSSPPVLPTTPDETWPSSTPSLPSTSDAFQFFPSKPSALSNNADPAVTMFTAHTPTAGGSGSHVAGLAQLHSDAFIDLRKTVTEAGEGFVRRMREFEAHRSHAGPSRVSSGASLSHYKRGRKRPSPAQLTAFARPVRAGRGHGNDHNDEESDVEINSNYTSGSDGYPNWSPSKKRAVSLGALNGKGSGPRQYSLPFPIPLRRGWSSSPSVYESSSDEEDEDIIEHVKQRYPTRFHYGKALSEKSNTPPLSFSFSESNNSSRVSLPLGIPQPIAEPSSMSAIEHMAPTLRSPKRAEKAIAALSLAIANGAGSVSDYDILRKAQGAVAMDNSEVGSLWD